MRVLAINEETRAKVRAVLEFAAHNFHRPGKNDARYAVMLDTFRCVFSYTQVGAPGTLYRHLSVSIPSERYPSPFAFYTIAELFGFTGWDGQSERPPKDWMLRVDEDDHCLIAAQKVRL
jgi:hypothetical protein